MDPWRGWSARDWVRHYAGPRLEPQLAPQPARPWDSHGFALPSHWTGQVRRVKRWWPREREFPLGFFDPAVQPVVIVGPPTPAQIVGTHSLADPLLYGSGGCLYTTAINFVIDGVLFAQPVTGYSSAADLLATINTLIEPYAVATAQPGTDFFVITTASTGATASISMTDSTGHPTACLGITSGALVTGSDTSPDTPGPGAVPIISRPQMRHGFRGERLIIPADIAVNFTLVDVKVGNLSQLANSTNVPAVVFVENGVGMRLLLDTAQVAMDIALVVANQSDTTLPFRATLIGKTPASDGDSDADESEETSDAAQG